MFVRTRLKFMYVVAALVSTFTLAMSPVMANAAASPWHLGYYTPSQHGTLLNGDLAPGSGLATFNFTNQPNVALVYSDQHADTGDLSNATLNASFDIANVTGTFQYYGEPSCGNPNSYVRYYFETSNAGGFNEAHYWWSNSINPAQMNFQDLVNNGHFTLPSVSMSDGSQWSDFYGHYGNDPAYSAGFTAATQNVTRVGLSFGGGCFFENGVGTSDGSGMFTLDSFSAN